METSQQARERRQRIVEEMLAMPSMKRGTLNEQYLRVSQKGKKEGVLRGPYYVLSRKEAGRTVSQRVPASEVEQVRQDIRRYERFVQLSREFVEVTQRLGELEREGDAAVERLKKRRNRRREGRGNRPHPRCGTARRPGRSRRCAGNGHDGRNARRA